ncbi:MAG TPA: MXAN_5187 C-terminal domain-containing protein, partial [Anaeromyxobacteraceae bacterium]|nr:MXAN_5187 C-terminal domain-containing protein [Anaeromyxobacteraceae bacterium]
QMNEAATPLAPPTNSLAAAVAAAASPNVKLSASPRPAPTPAARATGGKVADAEMRALFDQYVAAKKRCNEDVSKLSYESVARSVAKQVPELMAKHKASTVEFKVVVKDGKAVLKAIPRT